VKALIIHDREAVAKDIEKILAECGFRKDDVAVVDDVRSANAALREQLYDIAIIDLTLPYKKGHPQSYQAVESLLIEIFETDSLHIPADIIGITHEKDAAESVSRLIGSHVLAIIEEDEESMWREHLKDKLSYVRRASDARQASINHQYGVDVCLVTALDTELAGFSRRLSFVDDDRLPGLKRFIIRTPDGRDWRGVALAIGRAGQPSAASWTQHLVTLFRPRLLVMSGICGGIKGKVKLGDIVIFQNVFDWDYGKWAVEKSSEAESDQDALLLEEEKQVLGRRAFYARPTPIGIEDQTVVNVCRELKTSGFEFSADDWTWVTGLAEDELGRPSVKFAPAASGSAVIADEFVIPRIKSLNEDIVAADMESYGFYYACKHTTVAKPKFVCVKAVSDFCDHRKNDGVQQACNFISASAAVHIIEKVLTSLSVTTKTGQSS